MENQNQQPQQQQQQIQPQDLAAVPRPPFRQIRQRRSLWSPTKTWKSSC